MGRSISEVFYIKVICKEVAGGKGIAYPIGSKSTFLIFFSSQEHLKQLRIHLLGTWL